MPAMGTQLWNEYGVWLVNRVRLHKPGYSRLTSQLHNTIFKYVLDLDENRASDGIVLREEFYREKDIDAGVYDHRDDCSVLEMLVALAGRIDDEYIGDPGQSHPELIFWDMICNLGLDVFDDRHYEDDEVEYILDRWMDRKFKPDGSGSIFPINRIPRRDQRRIEIWSQMNEYLTEKGY